MPRRAHPLRTGVLVRISLAEFKFLPRPPRLPQRAALFLLQPATLPGSRPPFPLRPQTQLRKLLLLENTRRVPSPVPSPWTQLGLRRPLFSSGSDAGHCVRGGDPGGLGPVRSWPLTSGRHNGRRPTTVFFFFFYYYFLSSGFLFAHHLEMLNFALHYRFYKFL